MRCLQSLTTLGLCIKHLTENKPYIPYRDSKLTRLLCEVRPSNRL